MINTVLEFTLKKKTVHEKLFLLKIKKFLLQSVLVFISNFLHTHLNLVAEYLFSLENFNVQEHKYSLRTFSFYFTCLRFTAFIFN